MSKQKIQEKRKMAKLQMDIVLRLSQKAYNLYEIDVAEKEEVANKLAEWEKYVKKADFDECDEIIKECTTRANKYSKLINPS